MIVLKSTVTMLQTKFFLEVLAKQSRPLTKASTKVSTSGAVFSGTPSVSVSSTKDDPNSNAMNRLNMLTKHLNCEQLTNHD
jgi:hypothetical protein